MSVILNDFAMTQSTHLTERLWQLDPEEWSALDVDAEVRGLHRLSKYLRDVLRALADNYPHSVTHGYVAVTGVTAGVFKPVAAIGRGLDRIRATPTSGRDTL